MQDSVRAAHRTIPASACWPLHEITGGAKPLGGGARDLSWALARSVGIAVRAPDDVGAIDVTIDGADEIDAELRLTTSTVGSCGGRRCGQSSRSPSERPGRAIALGRSAG